MEIAEGRGGIMVVETANRRIRRSGGKIESLNLGWRKENLGWRKLEENPVIPFLEKGRWGGMKKQEDFFLSF